MKGCRGSRYLPSGQESIGSGLHDLFADRVTMALILYHVTGAKETEIRYGTSFIRLLFICCAADKVTKLGYAVIQTLRLPASQSFSPF